MSGAPSASMSESIVRIEYENEISIVKDGVLSFNPKSICIDDLICYHA